MDGCRDGMQLQASQTADSADTLAVLVIHRKGAMEGRADGCFDRERETNGREGGRGYTDMQGQLRSGGWGES